MSAGFAKALVLLPRYGSRTQVFARSHHSKRPGSNGSEPRLPPLTRLAWIFVAPIACTTILNIDGHYVSASNTTKSVDSGALPESGAGASAGATAQGNGGSALLGVGGTGTGGAVVHTGGAPPSGGVAGAAGSIVGAGGDVVVPDCSDLGCDTGLKCCGSPSADTKACYPPSPLVGCGDTGCDYCSDPIPDNATATCIDKNCAFACNVGFVQKNGACIAEATGGAGGRNAGGTPGTGGAPCVDRTCPTCGPAGPFGCCLPSGNCGCTYFDISLGGRASIGYCLPRPESIFPPR
jgi:hypothetical protein